MNTNHQTIDKRLKAIGVFVIAVTFIIFWRMVDLQVFQHDKYTAMADNQQRFEKVQMAERGKIYVHDSAIDPSAYYPLAFDIRKFALWVVPSQIKDKSAVADELAKVSTLPRDQIFSQINNNKLYIPPLERGLSQDDADKITNQKIQGVMLLPEYARYYPEGTLASQLLGFVNDEGKGNYGFEGYYNNELKGQNGQIAGEKDTLGRVIDVLQQTNPKDGNSYVLTIDRSTQYFVEKSLTQAISDYQATSGTVVVMDIKTGGIVAMASSPTYDPNDFKAQAATNQSTFMNPAISDVFEPGSIFKPLVMSAAIDQGLVTPDTSSVFGASVNVQGYTINTAERKAFGLETMTQVLQNSDNVGMVWVSDKLGSAEEYKYVNAYNFTDKTGIDLSGEVGGIVVPEKSWHDINRATVAFGQGIAVTPMQMVAAYAAIANGGKYIYPHVVDKILHPDGTETQIQKQEGAQIISKTTADTMAEMLYHAVQNGTGHHAEVPGFKISGKTGTAQIPLSTGGYETNDSGLGIFIHTVAGFAPTNDPRFAMLVKLDRPKTSLYAETTAAPLFGKISDFLLNHYYRVTPTEPIK